MLKLVIALGFFASGSFQHVEGKTVNITQPTVSRAVESVTNALLSRHRQHIKIPLMVRDQAPIKLGFHDQAGFPNVLGAVDGTHILLKAPAVNEHIYVNRKGAHSINVQGVCDHQMRFLNVVAKFPGATHDAYIWNQSALCQQFETGVIPNGWLLGDSAYPLKPWMMTPFLRPANPTEIAFNSAHARTRVAIERSFGLLKSRWRCLDKTGGVLCYKPEKVCRIVVAVAVLHNMCIDNRLPPPPEDDMLPQEMQPNEVANPRADPQAVAMRRNIADQIFQHRIGRAPPM